MTNIKLVVNETWTSEDHYDPGRVWKKSFALLDKLSALKPDWDGEGASPPDMATICNAINVMGALHVTGFNPPSRISATLDGAILVEWQNHDRYFEIEITASDTFEWVKVEGDQAPVHGEECLPPMGGRYSASPDSTISGEQHLLYA